jgi:hypothetical protein
MKGLFLSDADHVSTTIIFLKECSLCDEPGKFTVDVDVGSHYTLCKHYAFVEHFKATRYHK